MKSPPGFPLVVVGPETLSLIDIGRLTPLCSADKKNHQHVSIPTEIDA
jgi:hypothetical protein